MFANVAGVVVVNSVLLWRSTTAQSGMAATLCLFRNQITRRKLHVFAQGHNAHMICVLPRRILHRLEHGHPILWCRCPPIQRGFCLAIWMFTPAKWHTQCWRQAQFQHTTIHQQERGHLEWLIRHRFQFRCRQRRLLCDGREYMDFAYWP